MRKFVQDIMRKLQNLDQHKVGLVQAKVTAVSAGTKTATVQLEGVTLAGVKYMDHVTPVVNGGAWILDNGGGRWIIVGASS